MKIVSSSLPFRPLETSAKLQSHNQEKNHVLDDEGRFAFEPAVNHPGYRGNDEDHEAGDGDACVQVGSHEGRS